MCYSPVSPPQPAAGSSQVLYLDSPLAAKGVPMSQLSDPFSSRTKRKLLERDHRFLGGPPDPDEPCRPFGNRPSFYP